MFTSLVALICHLCWVEENAAGSTYVGISIDIQRNASTSDKQRHSSGDRIVKAADSSRAQTEVRTRANSS